MLSHKNPIGKICLVRRTRMNNADERNDTHGQVSEKVQPFSGRHRQQGGRQGTRVDSRRLPRFAGTTGNGTGRFQIVYDALH